MFESAEIEHDIDKATFEGRLPQLRTDILNAQFELIEAQAFPTILLFSGMEGTGVVDTLTSAYTVLDARHVIASAFDKPRIRTEGRDDLLSIPLKLSPYPDLLELQNEALLQKEFPNQLL